MTKLNVGCGSRVLAGYDNIDLYVTGPRISNFDIRALPYGAESVDEVLAEDILEHFPRLEWKAVVTEWVRVLKPGGLITFQFPEMRHLADALYAAPIEKWEEINRRIFGGQGDGRGDGKGMFHYSGFSRDFLQYHLEKQHGLLYVSHHFHNFNCTLSMKKRD